jgi:hypothetical protein
MGRAGGLQGPLSWEKIPTDMLKKRVLGPFPHTESNSPEFSKEYTKVIRAISVSGSVNRLTKEQSLELGPLVRDAAPEVSRRIVSSLRHDPMLVSSADAEQALIVEEKP